MRNDPKLAVLLSGSYRNIEDVWPANKKILDSLKVPYDVFFHTWTENHSFNINVLEMKYKNKFYFSIIPKVYRSFPQKISEKVVREKFGFFSIQVEEFQEDYIASSFNLGNRKSNRLFQSQLNSCGMYLGIDSVVRELFKASEYSHFLRLRPDFKLDSKTSMELFNCDLVFFGQLLPTDEGLIGDQCYGGDLSKSAFILRTLEKLHEITHSPDWDVSRPVVLAENIVRLALKPYRNEIEIGFFDGSGFIQRPTVKIDIHRFGIQFLSAVVQHNLGVIRGLVGRIHRKVRNHWQSDNY